jgi:hypothetical protein
MRLAVAKHISRDHRVTTGWRVDVESWAHLPPAAQRDYLRIVGDYGGEWWGGGHSEFDSYHLAEACVREADSVLGVQARVAIWVRPERSGRA